MKTGVPIGVSLQRRDWAAFLGDRGGGGGGCGALDVRAAEVAVEELRTEATKPGTLEIPGGSLLGTGKGGT